ncbi:hypothetical protein RHOSPDRAFT_24988 [Rhodotorula sp. JG-1b]|nr:hypothetical protein RHOSPDRAFT_24988 [Rhodotorula sp. JG-1b]
MSLSALPKEVQLIIAEHAVENVGPDESSAISFDASEHVDLETAQTRRCISVLASLNKHWYELCRPMLWKVRQTLYMSDMPSAAERARKESIKDRFETMRRVLSDWSDWIQRVELVVESNDPPVLRALQIALQALPTSSVKRLSILHGGYDDSDTVPCILAACVGIANGVSALDLEVSIGREGWDGRTHAIPADPITFASYFKILLCAAPKLVQFHLKAFTRASRRWTGQQQRCMQQLLESAVQIRSCERFLIDMPYLSTLASAIERRRNPTTWQPTILALVCDPRPETIRVPHEPPPFYRILDKVQGSVRRLMLSRVRPGDIDDCTNTNGVRPLHFRQLDDIEFRAEDDETFLDFATPAFLRLVDPRTPLAAVDSGFVTPGFVDEVQRFARAQSTRTLKLVMIPDVSSDKRVKKLERRPRRDLERWCEEEEIELEIY